MINEYIKIRNNFKDCVVLIKSGIFYYTYDNDMYLKSKISYKGYLSNCCSGSFIRSHSWFDGIDMKVKKKKTNEVIVSN